ncbi:HlyD family efflux transporter periplasmic adaptor subunit [Salinarimonas rosea]|uniref:HlyD family efflux transporter periplasmic adaptor subunit n=1 Tax=Salinarimonas rosea TaxID=552063 RepID=UPI000412EC88|nr:HlyD family efflux transporter periplasmic adaptor subunit [Salinarimonas rosea]
MNEVSGRRTDLPGVDLPLADSGIAAPREPRTRRGLPKRLRLVPVVMLLLFTGAVVGLYFQPPALRAFFGATGLEPGGGTTTPIAVAPAPARASAPEAARRAGDVVALGRLVPEGDVITLAPPFGAGDARVAEIRVEEGRRVAAGTVVALLDNRPQLLAALESAEATVAVREAAVEQTRRSTQASAREAGAELERARATLALAEGELARTRELGSRGVATAAQLDRAEATRAEAARTVERAEAALSRWQGAEDGTQPDIVLAERNLVAARADLARARGDLAKAEVIAPVAGTVLEIHARIGEKPGASGVATLADVDRMTAELEVYQSDIRLVEPGQPATIRAEALGDDPLVGNVTRIGLEVGRQSVIGNDPAANTDARVVTVTVTLDEASARRAARLSGLEVVGRIETGG